VGTEGREEKERGADNSREKRQLYNCPHRLFYRLNKDIQQHGTWFCYNLFALLWCEIIPNKEKAIMYPLCRAGQYMGILWIS